MFAKGKQTHGGYTVCPRSLGPVYVLCIKKMLAYSRKTDLPTIVNNPDNWIILLDVRRIIV